MTVTGYVFISYAHADGRAHAEKLDEALRVVGIKTWIDKSNLEARHFDANIQNAIKEAAHVAACLTHDIERTDSWVRDEIEYALKHGRPVIPLVFDDVDIPIRIIRDVYVDFRNRTDEGWENAFEQLLARLGFSNIAQRKRIDYGLLEQRQEIAKAIQQRHELTPQRVVGQHLMNIDSFKNRDQERLEIGRLLAAPSTRIVSIIGVSGIGKTALASHILGNLETDQWPHTNKKIPVAGIVYMSTRTAGVTLERIFLDCAEMLGGENEKSLKTVWVSTQLNTRDKVIKLLKALRDGPYILLMDNMEELMDNDGQIIDEDLRTFLELSLVEPHQARILFTSRIPLVFPKELMRFDNRVTLLVGLPPLEAVALLRECDPNGEYQLRDAQQDQLIRVVEKAHGIPLALQLVAHNLANHHVTLDQVVEQFYQLPEVEDYAEESFNRLEGDSRHGIEALAVFEHPMPFSAIDFLLEPFFSGLDVPNILLRSALKPMVSIGADKKSVSVLSVVRDYIYAQLPEEGKYCKRALERRAASYYSQLTPPKESWQSIEALEPKVIEFEHLIKANDYVDAADLLGEIDRDYLLQWGYAQRVLSMRQQLSNKIGDERLEGVNTGSIGEAYIHLGLWPLAIENYTRAASIAHISDDLRNEAWSLGRLGYCYHVFGDYDKAILGYFEPAIALAQQVPDQNSEARFLDDMGDSLARQGKYEDALKDHLTARDIARSNNNKYTEASCVADLGYIYAEFFGEVDRAIEYYREATEIISEKPNIDSTAIYLSNLASNYQTIGEYKSAIEAAQQSLAIARETGNKTGEALRLMNLSKAYTELGEYDKALAYQQQAADIVTKPIEMEGLSRRGDRAERVGVLRLYMSNYDEALVHMKDSLKIAVEIGNPYHRQKRGTLVAQIYLHLQQLDHALEAIESARKFSTPVCNYETATIYGLILTQCQKYNDAKKAFQQGIDDADALLSKTPHFVQAKYMRAQALAGLFLLSDEDSQISRASVENAYVAAQKNCDAKGIKDNAFRLAEELKSLDNNGLLATIRETLS